MVFRRKPIYVMVILTVTLINFSTDAIPSDMKQESSPKEPSAEYQHDRDTQNKVTVDVYAARIHENFLNVEFISLPPGMVELKSAELVSPEGTVYGPTKTYEISEEAAKNLGRLRPIAVPKGQKPKTPTSHKVGSMILGAGLTALSGLGRSSASTPYASTSHYGYAAKQTHTGLSSLGVVGGLAPAMLNQTGGSSSASSENVEWIEPQTAGTGIFSSVAEFALLSKTSSHEPWHLKAEMQHRDGKKSTYTFTLQPSSFVSGGTPPSGPPSGSIWDNIELSGPKAKLLSRTNE